MSVIWQGCEQSAVYVRAVRSALTGIHYIDPDGDFGALEWAWLLAHWPWRRWMARSQSKIYLNTPRDRRTHYRIESNLIGVNRIEMDWKRF